MEVFPGFLGGLSVGIYCLGACLPVFVPLLVSRKRTNRASFWLVIEFSLGRLGGYLFFGTLVGFLGKTIDQEGLHRLASLATVSIGVLMVGYSLGLLGWGLRACSRLSGPVKIPFLLGFLTGVSPCPPFLASLSYVFNLKDVLKSLVYFGLFFLGTSLYILPLAFLGVFSRRGFFQKIAQVSGVLVGAYFVWAGLRFFW